jgi:hypothetical protein
VKNVIRLIAFSLVCLAFSFIYLPKKANAEPVTPDSYSYEVINTATLYCYVETPCTNVIIMDGATPIDPEYMTINFVNGYTLVGRRPLYLVEQLTEPTNDGYYALYRFEYIYSTY